MGLATRKLRRALGERMRPNENIVDYMPMVRNDAGMTLTVVASDAALYYLLDVGGRQFSYGMRHPWSAVECRQLDSRRVLVLFRDGSAETVLVALGPGGWSKTATKIENLSKLAGGAPIGSVESWLVLPDGTHDVTLMEPEVPVRRFRASWAGGGAFFTVSADGSISFEPDNDLRAPVTGSTEGIICSYATEELSEALGLLKGKRSWPDAPMGIDVTWTPLLTKPI